MTAILSLSLLAFGAAPGLVADQASIDRGELKAGVPLVQSFAFANRSTQTVVITGVNVSCGCTKHALDRTKLAPGESAKLTADVNTLAQAAGPWSWTANVRWKYEASEAEETTFVSMKGTLSREIALEPPGLAFSLEAGTLTQSVFVTDSRPAPLTVKGAAASSSILSVIVNTEKSGVTRLSVTVSEAAPLGEHRETIVLATSDPAYPELRVPVTVVKKSPAKVKAYPEAVQFAESLHERVLIRRPDGKPVQIAACEPDDGNLTVSWSKSLDPAAVVSVKIPSRYAGTSGRAVLKVRLAEPDGEIIAIPVSWGR